MAFYTPSSFDFRLRMIIDAAPERHDGGDALYIFPAARI